MKTNLQTLLEGIGFLDSARISLMEHGEHNREILPLKDDTIYVSLMPEKGIAVQLRAMVLEIKEHLVTSGLLTQEQVDVFHWFDVEEFHTTLIYSRTGGPEVFSYVNELQKEEAYDYITANVTGVDIFGKCLVLTLDSDDLMTMNGNMMRLGASSDYDSYTPHTTIMNLDQDEVDPLTDNMLVISNEIQRKFGDKLRNITLIYETFTVEPLNED